MSRKRKSVDVETDATLEPKPRKHKKRDENRMAHRRLPYPDPTVDESLSQQSRKALSYAYERCQSAEQWKFSKARQNWLLRNVWSEQQVPAGYVPLVIEYLNDIKGGAREKLIAVCTSKLSTSEDKPVQQPSDGSTSIQGSTVNPHTSTSRALSILDALRENNQNHEFDHF